jgi:peptide/nickel transport system permease protein
MLFATMFIFFFINLTPLDPATQMLPVEHTQAELEALHHELGLDRHIVIQYFDWLWKALHGDLGISYSTRAKVWDEIEFRIPITFMLSLVTTVFVLVVGMPLGVFCAVKQYSIFDGVVNVTSKLLGAFPQFWLALMCMLLFSSRLRWLPSHGITTWKHWILPVITLALPSIANYIRQSRSSMLDCIRQDYVRTARSKGAKESTVIFRDTLRNALLPMITVSGQQFALLIGNAVVVEKVFAIPGIGSKVVEAINSKDIPTVLACTFIIAFIYILLALVIDIAYAIVDPRIETVLVGTRKE